MAESRVAQLLKKRLEKAKSYKAEFDVERAKDLLQVADLIRDFPGQAALAAAAGRELAGMNMKQTEQDLDDKEEADKEMAAARAADARGSEDERPLSGSPPSSPRANLLDTRR